MGAGVTPIAGLVSTDSGTLASIVPRHSLVGATEICQFGAAMCQLSSSTPAAGILPYGYADRMSVGRHPRRTLRARTPLRKLVSLQGYIVIVEPDDLIRELLERWLGEAGYGVILSPKEPSQAAVKPRLVVADVSSPDSAGATIKALRAAYSAP